MRFLSIAICVVCGPLFLQAVLHAHPQQRAVSHPAEGLELDQIPWMDDGAQFLDRKRFKTSLTRKERAVDRNALVDTALGRAQEEGRIVLWYVPKFSESTKRGRQMIRAPVLDIAMRQLIWGDEAVANIVRSHFVPLRMVCDETMSKRFSLRPLEILEPSLVFLRADGSVLHVLRTIRTFDANWIAHVLRDVLRLGLGKAKSGDGPLAISRGEWQLALDAEQRAFEGDMESLLRQAVLKRRMRDGAGALGLIAEARKSWEGAVADATKDLTQRRKRSFLRAAKSGGGRFMPSGARKFAILVNAFNAEEGLILTRMGRFSEALPLLRAAADASLGNRRPEAHYLLALLRLRQGHEMEASRRFQKLSQDYPNSSFGRRARANVVLGIDDNRPLGAAFSGLERTIWLPESSYTHLPKDTAWPGGKLPISDAVDSGLRFLLRQQRANGGWNDSRYSYCPDTRITPNVWMAVSALSCQALLRYRNTVGPELRKRIDDALWRGERFLRDDSQVNRGRNEDVYADAYRLDYYALRMALAQTKEEKAQIRALARHIIRDVESRQGDRGFWAHEYANAFCTAAMVQSLLGIREFGVPVPETMLKKSTQAILSGRRANGSFSYGGRARGKGSERDLKNASTRMPLCESALVQLGSSDSTQLAFAFRVFWEHISSIEGVRRTDFHSDGEIAGFMFFHTIYHTSRAIDALPVKDQGKQRARLLERVLSYGEIDGTFMDSHELGRSYGTAMALLAIANTNRVGK